MIAQKKAIMSFNFLVMITRIIFLILVLIINAVLINMFLNDALDVNDVRAEVLVNGIMYSYGGISYIDPVSGRSYPGIVDISQVSDFRLDNSLYYPDNHMITARVSISTGVGEQKELLSTVYYNRQWYDNWEPLLGWRSIGGIGGIHEYSKELPIIVRKPEGLVSGTVSFQVLQPKGTRAK